jgi:hypothetical protein
MGRFARSFTLFKTSYRVLMKDKELLVLPVVSGLAILAVCASFFFGMDLGDRDLDRDQGALALPTFLFYVVTYTISFFFQAAIVAGASERLAGGDPTLGSALGAAGRRFPALLAWGVIAATVGMLIRAVQERSELVGKIVMGLIGVVWSLATVFMVPVLVMERQPVGASFKRSWSLFKQTWGESVVGSAGIGIVGFLGFVALAGIVALLAVAKLALAAVVVAVLGFAMLMVLLSALQAVYVASLYRYATTGEVTAGFDRELLEHAFAAKKQKARGR